MCVAPLRSVSDPTSQYQSFSLRNGHLTSFGSSGAGADIGFDAVDDSLRLIAIIHASRQRSFKLRDLWFQRRSIERRKASRLNNALKNPSQEPFDCQKQKKTVKAPEKHPSNSTSNRSTDFEFTKLLNRSRIFHPGHARMKNNNESGNEALEASSNS